MPHISDAEFGKLLIHNGSQEFQGDKPLDQNPHLSLGEWGVQDTQVPETGEDWRTHPIDLSEIRRTLGYTSATGVSEAQLAEQEIQRIMELRATSAAEHMVPPAMKSLGWRDNKAIDLTKPAHVIREAAEHGDELVFGPEDSETDISSH